MSKHHNHSKGGFEHGHDTLKVTVTYKGHPAAIDDAIHGATRETEWAKAELDKADATIADLADVNDQLEANLFAVTLTAEDLACDLAAERKVSESLRGELNGALARARENSSARWTAEDAKYAAERRESYTRSKLNGEIARKDATIAKLQAALTALTTGEITASDITAFMESRNPALDVNKPVSNPEYVGLDDAKYPFALLLGEKEDVRKQVLACFVDDELRANKIQAIKTLRERSRLGLRESKDLVEWACHQGVYAGR